MELFQARRDKLRSAWRPTEIDAFLVRATSNVNYLTGFTGDSSVLLVGTERDLIILDGRFHHAA